MGSDDRGPGRDEVDATEGPSLLAAVLDALPELVFVLDRDGSYVQVLGGRDAARYHDGRSLVGRRMHDVLSEELADAFLARIHEALDTDQVVTYEYTLSAQDVDGVESSPDVPDHLWFEGRIAPLPPAPGRDGLVVWMLFNVTDARVANVQLEQQTKELEQQRAELDALATSKQRILSVVSHDLRAPLTAIRGFLELLLVHGDELATDQVQDFLRRGLARTEEMQQMLLELLDASRHEHVEAARQPRDVRVADVVEDVVGSVAGAEDDVVVHHADEHVHADPDHLRRIVANLLDNARKYGGPPVEISVHRDEHRVEIRVRDHGDGIPDAFVPRLFSAFAQAHAQPGADRGIGLGLSIVDDLARENRGAVAYEPVPEGACFVVTLPAAAGQAGASSPST